MRSLHDSLLGLTGAAAICGALSSVAVAVAVAVAFPAIARGASAVKPIDLRAFRIIPRESGPTNYYRVVSGSAPFIHSAYEPPMKTAVLGFEIPDAQHKSIAELRWKWRAIKLPKGGDECSEGHADSAAVVYVTWRRGLRWYSVKYVWSAVGRKGQTCERKRNMFRAQDTVIIESGPPLGEWRSLHIVPDVEYRNHFENGDASADVPDLIGIGIMSDGDQTHSPSSADFADFQIVEK